MEFKEKKRWVFLGLPFTFTTYTITEEIVTIDEGFLNRKEDDCYMYKIQDVTLTTSLFERIMGLGTVIGIAMISAFNREPLVLTGGMFIMVVALVVRRLPYTIRSSVAILQQIPLYVEEAALSLGSSKPKAFFTVTLPMMSSGVLSGAILSWVTLISELSTAILLYTGKTQTLTVAIYTQIVRGNYGIASAMATVLTVMTLLSLLIFNKISKDGDLTM